MKAEENKIISEYKKAKQFVEQQSMETFFKNKAQEFSICIFGGGALGRLISKWLIREGIFPSFFCDNNLKMEADMLEGKIPYIPFEILLKQKEKVYVIVAVADQKVKHNHDINEQLCDFPHVWHNPLGITTYLVQKFNISAECFASHVSEIQRGKFFRDAYSQKLYEKLLYLRLQANIVDYPTDFLNDFYDVEQYIADDLIDYTSINSFVDCGAFTGDSLDVFLLHCNSQAVFYLFEMDKSIREKLDDSIAKKYSNIQSRIHVYPYGVGKERESVTYLSDETGASAIDNNASETAEIIPLDDIEFETKIDFIKMDIEGEEENALWGAKKLIQRDHPILAISMYHNMRQFALIPQIIHMLEPGYIMYLRHYKNTIDDTICYAIYKG